MELRSRTHKKLADILKSAGAYEANMEVEEMRELVTALESSANADDQDLERVLHESELEFLCSQPSALHNSTMIIPPQGPTMNPNLDSPPSEPICLTVRAVVHHAMDWSPTAERRLPVRKRSAGDHNQIIDQDGKRSRPPVISSGQDQQNQEQDNQNPDATPVSIGNEGDSGVSWEEASSLSSVSDAMSMPSIGEMPDRHLISTSSAAVSDFSDIHEHSHD
ncbi:uncharacterized protein LOC108045828 [Drosophila rhopaloa]|uniref:Uncharacterized protein LOC108045828 n=1 Tax=Drosophila rhopaloa TaxID=1041015 RepID=A0A6P4F5W5_DRORH|nr:uncharacterized protein LOC108045828 [Drosophila rhopaloa]